MWRVFHKSSHNFITSCKVSHLQVKKDRGKHHCAVDKHSQVQQFCKSNVITFVVQKSRSIHLAQPKILWQSGWLADKIQVNFELLKIAIDQNFKFLLHLEHYYSSINVFKLVFSAKLCFKVVVRSAKIQKSLLIPTIK